MTDQADRFVDAGWVGERRCNVRRALPRHFLFPALLLLLTEEPCHGYGLVDALVSLGFGPLDRPSVYRALADLESDGLLRCWTAAPTAGSTRFVYSVTPRGSQVLETWMEVVSRQRDCLDLALTRYRRASAPSELTSMPSATLATKCLPSARDATRRNGADPTH